MEKGDTSIAHQQLKYTNHPIQKKAFIFYGKYEVVAVSLQTGLCNLSAAICAPLQENLCLERSIFSPFQITRMNTPRVLAVFPAPLASLTEHQKPLWGKMTPQHMLEHLAHSMRYSTSQNSTKIITEERHLPLMRRLLFSDRPLPRNLGNPAADSQMPPLKYGSMQEAYAELLHGIDEFYHFFEQEPAAVFPHPYFGVLNFGEWERFHYKHFTHHCNQFGIRLPVQIGELP